jgi:hypothetical protein
MYRSKYDIFTDNKGYNKVVLGYLGLLIQPFTVRIASKARYIGCFKKKKNPKKIVTRLDIDWTLTYPSSVKGGNFSLCLEWT